MDSTIGLSLVIYDISDNRRRRKAVKILNSYGNRVQESAFECKLTMVQELQLLSKLKRVLSEAEDNLRIYRLNSLNKITCFGTAAPEPDEAFGFI